MEYLSHQICARTNDFMTDSNDDLGVGCWDWLFTVCSKGLF